MTAAAGTTYLPDAVPMVCNPGDVVISNRQLLHGSFANTSDKWRVTVNMGCLPRQSVIGVRGGGVHLGRERHRQREEGQSWNREKRDRARRDREADFQHRSTSCGCGQATDGGGLQVEIGVSA